MKNLLEEKEVRLEISQNENLFSEYKKFEAIIITLEVLCFKHEIPMDQFFEQVRNLYTLIGNLGISVERLSEYLENQKNEILRLQSETKNEVERQGETMNLLQEYQANMPAFKTAMNGLENVTRERDSCRRELDYFREQYQPKGSRPKRRRIRMVCRSGRGKKSQNGTQFYDRWRLLCF